MDLLSEAMHTFQMQLAGFHHLTAVTADASGNHSFYTGVLGLRLVKKTVNQDDVSAYHLFYADGKGSPGTDLTFFDWPAPPERRGTRSIVQTGLRVPAGTLEWWEKRFQDQTVSHQGIGERDGRRILDFEDFEGQRLSLVEEQEGQASTPWHPWSESPVPPEKQVRGLGPITISVPELEPTERFLTIAMNMRRGREYSSSGNTYIVFEMGKGGPSAELHVVAQADLDPARMGAGGVHHVAFRAPEIANYEGWLRDLAEKGVATSGPVDRFYFKSLYFREPSGILFEIATDGPGFAVDEPLESLGEGLALPPFLEPRRQQIEAGLRPL